jgi:hypothetical protein
VQTNALLAAHGTHAVVPIVGAVVAFLGAVHDAVTAVRRQLALRRAATIRAVQDAVVARLGPILDTVATVRGVDAAGRAATIVTDIEECPVVALLGRLDVAVAAPSRQATGIGTIGIVRHGWLAFFAVVDLNDAVATPWRARAIRIASSVGTVIHAVVAGFGAVDAAIPAAPAALAVRHAAIIGDVGIGGGQVSGTVVTFLVEA